MSSNVDLLTLDCHLSPRSTPTLTSASIALRTAKQGQFQSIDETTPILQDQGGGSHTLVVQCKPANIWGRVEAASPVTIRVRAALARTITKPTAATVDNLLSAVLDPDGSDLIAVVLPRPADGVVELRVALDAADAAVRATLQHRHYAATAELPIA